MDSDSLKMSEHPVCIACWSDIVESQPETICYYGVNSAGKAKQISAYCWVCATYQVSEFFQRWQQSVDEADCAAALRRLITQGPPMTFADIDRGLIFVPDAMIIRGDEIFSRSASLDGAPKTEIEKHELWAKLRERENDLPEEPEEPEAPDVFELKV